MRIEADRFPAAVGLKVTLMMQLLVVPRTDEQLWDSLKSPAFAPDTLIWLIATELFPVFESVIGCEALIVPTLWGAKLKLVGDNCIVGAIAVPEIATTCGLPEALSTKLRVAFFVPLDCGAKSTATMQSDAIATVPLGTGHALVPPGDIPKLDASGPEIPIWLRLSAVLPRFLRVMD